MDRSKGKISGFINRKTMLAGLIPLSFVPQYANAALTIVVSGTDALHFGTITESGAGGTVVVSTAGGRSVTGSVSPVVGAGLQSNGVFQVAASTGAAITLSVTSPAFTVSNGGGGVMSVNNFNVVLPAGGTSEVITLAVSPTTYPIGGTLNVGAGQAAGSYVGTIILNAMYQ